MEQGSKGQENDGSERGSGLPQQGVSVGETWYRVTGWTDLPEPVTVVKSTASYVTIRRDNGTERREARRFDGGGIFQSWESARDFIIRRHQEAAESAKLRWVAELKKLERAMMLPEAAP